MLLLHLPLVTYFSRFSPSQPRTTTPYHKSSPLLLNRKEIKAKSQAPSNPNKETAKNNINFLAPPETDYVGPQ